MQEIDESAASIGAIQFSKKTVVHSRAIYTMHKIAPLILIALNVKQYCAQATAQANDPISLAIEIFELRRPAIVCKGLAWDFVSSKPFPALITDMRAFSNFRLWQGGGGVICSKVRSISNLR